MTLRDRGLGGGWTTFSGWIIEVTSLSTIGLSSLYVEGTPRTVKPDTEGD